MKNILWLFLFSMLMSIESFGTLASYEADIQTLLSSGRSSFIAGKIREVLRSRLDSGPLTSDKIRKLIQSPQVAALCCLHQFFNTAEGGTLRKYYVGNNPDKVELKADPTAVWKGLTKVKNMSWRAVL